jgi:tetratricopeptide (TPR) repeat protein
MKFWRLGVFCLLSITFALRTGVAAVDEQLAKFRKAGVTATEREVYDLLAAGVREYRSAEVSVAAKEWLQTHPVKNAAILYLAGLNAEWAGSPEDAAIYYRKVLTQPSLNADVVSRAGPAFYRLLILGMKDPDKAYLFMREHGNRLRPFGILRKFDPWFLDQASARNDLTGMAERVAAMLSDGEAQHAVAQPYLDGFFTSLETFTHGEPELLDAVRRLAEMKQLSPVERARLRWVCEVVPLNSKVSELHRAKNEIPSSIYASAIEAATALLEADPIEGSRLVGRGWCHFSDHNPPDLRAKATLHRDLKSPMFMKALANMTDDQVRSVLATAGPHDIQIGVVLDDRDLRELVAQRPGAFNTHDGPDLPYYTAGMSVAEATAIAPHLEKNPSPHAAVVRAVAAGNDKVTTAAQYIAKHELWRFDHNYVKKGHLGRFLWECGLNRDGDFGKTDALLKQFAPDRKARGQGAKVAKEGTAPGGDAKARRADELAALSQELLMLPDKPTPAEVETALATVLKRIDAAPGFPPIQGLEKAAKQIDACRPYVRSVLYDQVPLDLGPGNAGYRAFAEAYLDDLARTKAYADALPVMQSCTRLFVHDRWSRNKGVNTRYIQLTEAAYEAGAMAVARGLSAYGLRFLGSDESLKKVFARASEAVGEMRIPVSENEKGYAIFLSQKEFMLNNRDTAWSLYDDHADDLGDVLEKLRLDYCFWLLQRNVEAGNIERVEDLVMRLTVWDRRGNADLSAEQQAEMAIAFAEAAFMKQSYGVARAWYRKVADRREYRGTRMMHRALLGIVAIDREERNYADALRIVEDLLLVKDERLRLEVRYALAEILFAQEKHVEALAEIERILDSETHHADALLLQGKVQLAMRDLVTPSHIRIGTARSTKVIEPGKSIEIDLKDPSLGMVGQGMLIEVEVRAASGDVERMTLRSVDEKQTLYRTEVVTELGSPRPGDKVLQVLGRDTITYGFSKRFRESQRDLPPDPDVSIGIASDFHLAISSGDFPLREGERQITMDELGLATADKAIGFRTLRPGNPVYVRVIDLDKSRTPGRDTVSVEVRSSSGDSIREFVLEETGPFTGTFEGAVPTASGQAVAFVYDSMPGVDPNMAISPRDDYPAWEGRATTDPLKKTFSVDLRDAIDLKTMILTTPEAKRPTELLLQCSSDNAQWDTLGCFPAGMTFISSGRPQVTWLNPGQRGYTGPNSTLKALPGEWAQWKKRAVLDPKSGIQSSSVKNVNGMGRPKNVRDDWVQLMHFRAMFYQPDVGTRRFQVTMSGNADSAFPGVLLVDGAPSGGDDASVLERELSPGLHTLELWAVGKLGTLVQTRLLCDGQDGAMQPCPDAMFDPSNFPPGIQAEIRGEATIRETQAGAFTIDFGANTRARFVRFVIPKHAGPAPAIKRLSLVDVKGQAILPVAEDYQQLRTNQQLEVFSGDSIVVKYVDDTPYTESRTQQEESLSVAFNNGSISASFLDVRQRDDGSRYYDLEPIRRFRMGDTVAFLITDMDMDVSGKRDVVPFTVRTSDGNTRASMAYETGEHTGVFLGKVFPVSGTPQRESEIQMHEGGTLTAVYRDMENRSGMAKDRSVTIEHAKYQTPRFGIYTVEAVPIPFKPVPQEQLEDGGDVVAEESVAPRMRVNSTYVDEASLKTVSPQGLYNGSIRFDVLAPHLALKASSRILAYAQTEAGRQAYAAMRKKTQDKGGTQPSPAGPFDVNVPGTLKIKGRIRDAYGPTVPLGYVAGSVDQSAKSGRTSSGGALDRGEFVFDVPLSAGDVPDRSFANEDAKGLTAPGSLAVQPGDTVHIGYAYFDEAGKAHWRTASVQLTGHVFLDMTDASYRTHLSRRFVGEKVFVRVIAPGLDASNDRDEVTVQVKADSGATVPFAIKETAGRSGVFKGNFNLEYLATPDASLTPQDLSTRGFPVRYSDTVVVSMETAHPPSFSCRISTGADGLIESFSKRYTDSSTAIKANFTLAECYFELAKMHRTMGEGGGENGEKLVSLSRREMAHAKKLLEEALATHHDPDQQAHAEYLLGNLAQEFADTSVNEQVKEDNYRDALARFAAIPVDYPNSTFAPKAQYKKALVYEKLKEYEIAVEEYVKLGYKYPNDERIPEAMSRIGGFFQERGIEAKKRADELLAKDDDTSVKTGQDLMKQAHRDFRWAGGVFVRVLQRYPRHPLAGLSGVRAGQNYMRCEDYHQAIEVFGLVYSNPDYDGPGLRAQALYWAGMSYEKLFLSSQSWYDLLHANVHYEICRTMFSASEWAKHARGRLASGNLGLPSEINGLKPKLMMELQARLM